MQGNAEHNLRGYAKRSQMLSRKAWRIGIRIPRKSYLPLVQKHRRKKI